CPACGSSAGTRCVPAGRCSRRAPCCASLPCPPARKPRRTRKRAAERPWTSLFFSSVERSAPSRAPGRFSRSPRFRLLRLRFLRLLRHVADRLDLEAALHGRAAGLDARARGQRLAAREVAAVDAVE